MRAVAFVPMSCLVASFLFAAACSSDPEPPKVDPGKTNDEGGTSFGGNSGQGGSGGGATGGTAGSVAGNAGSGGTVVAPPYPAGPFGQDPGSVVKDYQFSGLRNPKEASYVADDTTLKMIYLHDFYNPTKDVEKPRVLLLTWSALWCSVCKTQATDAMAEYNKWHPKGAEFIEVVFEDKNSEPSEPADLTAWTKTYKLEFPSVLDPGIQSGVFFDKSAAPFNMVIDLSTMTITYATAGLFDSASAEAEFSTVLGL